MRNRQPDSSPWQALLQVQPLGMARHGSKIHDFPMCADAQDSAEGGAYDKCRYDTGSPWAV
jgi:hypothetical protein